MRGIKRIYLAAVAIVAGALGGWSCAEDAPNVATGLARESFEKWVAKYAPAAFANPVKDVYIEYIERGPEGTEVPVLNYSWLTLNYTGKTLDGTVFVTRVDSISRRIGRFAHSTHYADDFTEFSPSSTKLCEGLRQALEAMRVGDSVRIYIPQNKAYSYSMTMNAGYAGEQGVTYAQVPIVFEMRLAALTTTPFVWERDSTERYAKLHWGSDYERDTVGMFRRIEKTNPQGDTITRDSTVYVYYEEYFMDGFLAATNIDTVARKWDVFDGTNENAYEPLAILSSSGENYNENKALFIAVPHMRKGEIAEVVTVSTWAQGDAGSPESTPEVLPYQPMRYRIHVLEKWPVEDDDTAEE